MKKAPIIVVILASLLVGLAAGYLLFRGQPAETPPVIEPGEAAHQHAGEEGTTYTCSMHPQIRQEEAGQCPICGMDLIPAGEAKADNPLNLEMTPEAVRLAQVETTVVGDRAAAENTLLLNGTIAADERRIATLVAHMPGRIDRLYVSFEGERVSIGQPIAEIYAPKLVSAQRELLEALKWEDTKPRLLEAAKNKLRNWKIPEAFIDRLIDEGQVRETISVRAEAQGIVQKRYVAVGDHVGEGGPLFDVVDLGRLWVLLDAYEEDIAKVKVGDRLQFTTPALPGQTFQTRITYIDPAIDPQTRVASLRGEIENRGGQLKPQMFVRATVQTARAADDGLVLPKTAVLWTGTRSVVYVAVPNSPLPSYEYREVVLGESLGNAYLVQSGIEPGEEVVTHGAFAIDAAAQLNNQRSMVNRMVSMKDAETADQPDYQAATPDAFRQQLHELAVAYLDLKDALVASDPEATRTAASTLLDQLNKVDMLLLQGPAHAYWMRQQDALQAHAGNIRDAEDLEQQREQFEFLSTALIQTLRAFGTTDVLFVQHCPMAFNDRGADWLSRDAEIRNPYFGEAMLTCGTVTDSLRL